MKTIGIFLLITAVGGSVLNGVDGKSVKRKYEVGQVWTYKTRDGERDSRLYIVKIEKMGPSKEIFHLSVDNLKVKNKRAPSGFQSKLPHIPVSAKTLDSSVVKLEKLDPNHMPDISAGYNQWKGANGGVFEIPIIEIIGFIETTVNR